MNFLTDWKFWLFAISLVGIIINFLSNHKLMNNHLHHLALDIKNIISKQEEQGMKINDIGVEVAFLKGRDSVEK